MKTQLANCCKIEQIGNWAARSYSRANPIGVVGFGKSFLSTSSSQCGHGG